MIFKMIKKKIRENFLDNNINNIIKILFIIFNGRPDFQRCCVSEKQASFYLQ